MPGWIKKFSDGSTERGSDTDVQAGRATWSRGRLDSMVGASISAYDLEAVIEGDRVRPFWQSDTITHDISTGRSGLLARRIQAQVLPGDLYLAFRPHNGRGQAAGIWQVLPEVAQAHVELISPSSIGAWLVLEIDLERGCNHYWSQGLI